MEVWGTPVLAEVEEIVDLARTELRMKGLDVLRDMKPMHNNIMVTCIAHGDGTEKKPSLGISTADVIRNKRRYPAGTCNCFTCGYTVDLPEFISNLYGHNDKGMFGYKWITENFVNLSIDKRKPLQLNMSREKSDEEIIKIIDEEVLKMYRFTHPYMFERKLNQKVIDYFDIGLDESAYAITFPVHDLYGNVRLIQRRSIVGKQFQNDEGAHRGEFVYGLYQVYKNLSWIKELYICESPIDALTCWVHRVPAVAIFGSRITATQVKLLRMLPVRRLISALDNDEAGNEGSEKLKKELGDTKMIWRLQYPEGKKDVNAMSEEQFLQRQVTIL